MSKLFQKIKQLLVKVLKLLAKIWLFLAKIVGSLILAVIVLVVIFGSSAGLNQNLNARSEVLVEGNHDEQIVVVRLDGEIIEDEDNSNIFSMNSAVITAKKTRKIFKRLAADPQVKAVIIRINSPGGSVVPSQEIYQQIRDLGKAKPVIASLSEVAASGGYYLAAAANKIVAHPATLTGSIGVIAMTTDASELYEKIGFKVNTYKSGEFKDMGSMSRQATEDEAVIFQSIITDSYEMFISDILASRDIPEDQLRSLADGRVYTGKQAYENHLVDELGNLDQAITDAQNMANLSNPTVIEYSLFGWWESFLNSKSQDTSMISQFSKLFFSSSGSLKRQSGVYYLFL